MNTVEVPDNRVISPQKSLQIKEETRNDNEKWGGGNGFYILMALPSRCSSNQNISTCRNNHKQQNHPQTHTANRNNKHDLPTPLSPINTNLNK